MLASPHSIDDKLEGEVPLAVVGIVPCKVTSENVAIHAGDLLVTSSRPGYAMKGTDRKRMLGAVVGKALEPLPKGAGEIQVLVATTVIEVGIDVPNATVMLVEDADRYGISQLHQLRGRIGRGQHASLCLLFGRKDAVRLKALERESDGFALAEIDLQLRGQGELAGTRQSGEAMFRFAEFPRDKELMERAHRYARDVIDADPDLTAPEHAAFRAAVAPLLPSMAPNRLTAPGCR